MILMILRLTGFTQGVMTMKKWMMSVVMSVVLLMAHTAHAGDAALYGAIAPANAGFFRIMNADATPLSVEFNGKSFTLAGGNCSPYAFAVAGNYTLKLNGQALPLTLSKGSQQTFLWLSGKATPVTEQPFKDKAKARLALYNLTTDPLSLQTATGKAILGPVSATAFASRDVNAVKMPFSVGKDGKVLASTAPTMLKRGQVTSLFALTVGGQTKLSVVEAPQ
jgi:alginate O-acetyltransferase complex protein AlgF